MRFQLDHDYHIHSQLSLCSNDPNQNTENILHIAENLGLRQICLADHYWDERVRRKLIDFYEKQNFAHISKALPLPQGECCRFLFGCETDMTKYNTVGIPKSRYDAFDMILIPIDHFHRNGFTISKKDFDDFWDIYEKIKELKPEVKERALKYTVLDNIKVAIKDKRKELKEIGAQWDELTPEEIAVKLVSSGRVDALYKAMKERENKINPSDFFSDQYQ